MARISRQQFRNELQGGIDTHAMSEEKFREQNSINFSMKSTNLKSARTASSILHSDLQREKLSPAQVEKHTRP